jgi:hypothetical protein
MAKKLIAVRLDPQAVKDLKKLAEADNRSQANMLETLIREKVISLTAVPNRRP